MTKIHKGSCECGSVTYELHGELRQVHACHCTQCRKISGHFWAATSVAEEKLIITHDIGLKWYKSSDFAKRGFCKQCGSSLFYKLDEKEYVAVAPGSLDGPTGLTTVKHIFVKDKGDYYDLDDNCEQLETW